MHVVSCQIGSSYLNYCLCLWGDLPLILILFNFLLYLLLCYDVNLHATDDNFCNPKSTIFDRSSR